MSTHSTITVRTSKGIRKSVYCHSDGYTEHNGLILFNSYNTLRKANRLTRGGDISSLGNKIKPFKLESKWFRTRLNKWGELVQVPTLEPHSFSNRHDDITTYYKRDRGDEGTETTVLKNHEEVDRQEYNYYFDGTKWLVDGRCLETELKRLKLI